ncbi:TetR/AcrR family transcriptional regulator [Actinocorallia sp. API 0066]|uniref:TetR/AcrR family transcriptional regulator n=1 Tax=Actinocorallia sp. API 0066 TaxID=2896846 RepID=UPI001E49C81C|nr:TetR/AcrR family transcriptional regulator [Actinocorallia sp. API 0066]MCD0448855.1 TetR/AcrR family transcriptional regulator [Actinocorallia sp. API 0066]
MAERREQIVAAALELLEADGREAMSMRGIAERVGIRAPSLYKHFPDKAAVELELTVIGLTEMAEALEAAEPGLLSCARAHRSFALTRPHLYRLTTTDPLPRMLPEGLEARAAGPALRATDGRADLARALWAFAHGMVMLELDGRFPTGADLEPAWIAGCTAFQNMTVKED